MVVLGGSEGVIAVGAVGDEWGGGAFLLASLLSGLNARGGTEPPLLLVVKLPHLLHLPPTHTSLLARLVEELRLPYRLLVV
jgi:hypothetical protein